MSHYAGGRYVVSTSTITSATAAFGTTIVGNIIYLQGGSGGLTAGWYEVTARASSSSITVDRNVAAGTGITMNIGGALLTIQKAVDNMAAATSAADQLTWVKSGTYNLTAAITTTTPSAVLRRNRVYGYDATRGDYPTGSNRPTIKTNGNAIDCVVTGADWHWANFILDGSGAAAGLTGCQTSASFGRIENCKVTSFATQGIYISAGGWTVLRCEVTDIAANGAIRIDTSLAVSVIDCWVHDNTIHGLVGSGNPIGLTVVRSIFSNNTGTSDGINTGTGYTITLLNNVCYGNGRDGIRWSTSHDIGCNVRNNVMVNNGGYGINATVGGFPAAAALAFDYNAFYNNTSGARNVIGAGPNDVTLTADPFTNAGADDFSLNTTAGGGAALRSEGYPGAFPGGLTTGYLDIGAAQHADPVGGGAPRSAGMSGGIF